jgi:MFS family permease
MFRAIASVAALLLGATIMMIGNSLLGLTLPLKLNAAGFAHETIGVIMAAYFAGLWTGSAYGKALIGQVGHIRAFAGFAGIITAVALAYPMLFNPVSWGILRFLGGFCVAGVFAVLESWLNERSENKTRGQVLSIYMIAMYGAGISGQLMVNLWGLDAVEGFAMAAMLTALSLVPVVLTRVEAPRLEDIQPLSVRELYRISPLALVGSCFSGMAMSAYYGMGPIFARDAGFGVLQVSLFMSSVILGGMLLQWPIGRISDRFDRRTVLVGILALVVLICIGGGAASIGRQGVPVFLGLGLLLGGTMTTIYPICVAQAFDYLPRARYVGASSGLLLGYSVGATFGPIVASFAMGRLGNAAFFGFIGAVAAVLALFVVYRMIARAALPQAQQEPVVAVPRMSPVGAELDPRAHGPGKGEHSPAAPAPDDKERAAE